MDTLPVMALSLGASLLLMAFLYPVSARKSDLGLVDLGWALAVGLSGLLYALLLEAGDPMRRAVVAAMGAVWSLRLAAHLFLHRIRGRVEDARYRSLRRHWGPRARYYAPALFALEAPLAVVFSVPLLAAMLHPAPFPTGWDLAGLGVWLVAIAGETAADRQLERFRAEPANRGRTCRVGLWNYSRHPNYFFEWMQWWAYVLLAAGSHLAFYALLGPGLMLLFLFRFTGIPHAERQALAGRGEDYRRYQRTTSVFVPWFKRREAGS
jgi:steroid 5-alpha reductase family enzyme